MGLELITDYKYKQIDGRRNISVQRIVSNALKNETSISC